MSEAKKVSAIAGVFGGRCPACRKGAVFTGPWNRVNFLDTHEYCEVCNSKFEPEPGFFIGAMYVNYSFNVATLTAVSLFLWVVFDPESAWTYVITIMGVTILAIPFTTRLSRMVWLYLFGPLKYDPTLARKSEEQ